MVTIRKATDEDILLISEMMKVLDMGELNPSDPSSIEKILEQYVVAFDGQYPVGAMSLNVEEGSCEIYTLTSRKPGTGRALIEYAEQICRDRKLSKLWCWSLARYNARGFYEKVGFEEAFLMKKQWFGEDSYLFGKVIV